MYQQYLKDPESVDKAWWDFFADYTPADATPNGAATAPATAAPTETKERQAAAEKAAPVSPPAAPKQDGESTARGSGLRANEATERSEGARAPEPQSEPSARSKPLKGAAARVVSNMEASLTVPTATSVRVIPAKLLIDNRVVVNNHLRRGRGGKVSFTHLIGYALVKALREFPVMNRSFAEVDGKPTLVEHEHVNLGLAIDLQKGDGTRTLVVPNIRNAETLDFSRFWAAYEDIIRRARGNKLTADDFAGSTISLTNPGTIGTVHSVPRLMSGQGAIIGVGAMEYPAEYQGASE